jgi:hypothetical protein
MVRQASLRDIFICSEIYFDKNKTPLSLHNEVDFVKRGPHPPAKATISSNAGKKATLLFWPNVPLLRLPDIVSCGE